MLKNQKIKVSKIYSFFFLIKKDIELWNEEINLAISMINQAKSILIVAGAGYNNLI